MEGKEKIAKVEAPEQKEKDLRESMRKRRDSEKREEVRRSNQKESEERCGSRASSVGGGLYSCVGSVLLYQQGLQK